MKKLLILLAAVLISTASFAQKNIDNVFYFRVGYSNPSWKQFGYTNNDWIGYGRSGAMAEIGKIYMLKSIAMPENMAIGLNVDYFSTYWHKFSYNQDDISVDRGTLRIDSKIGPSFTYTPIDNLAVDVYVKADFAWVVASVRVINDNTDDAIGYAKIGALGISTGFNVRYNKLMLGLELSSINPKLENVDYKGSYLGNRSDYSSDKTPLPSMSFSIGLNF
jgi:hypothetical protein